MAKRKPAKRKRAPMTNPGQVTARKTRGGYAVSAKVKTLKAAKSLARKMGARKG